ncbi:hypothetical protein OU426_08965 [Frigidibacter sp. RF13]|uniref:hypothetical protein n=1 Tax=Frigidibacter sp. RF13 TaxID=2997340 RepID=UPI00226FE152|nr:hypothetical protein [Frigidibacter sp. RF13]MCY1126984.1 hypothetical protein [Frigidibacter sp. RF13]
MLERWLPEDRAMRIGLYVSGAAHLALILWALLGGIFFTPEPAAAPIATNVSLMSSAEFAELEGRKPTAAEESPPQPSAPEASVAPPAKPKPETKPEQQPAPDVTPPEPEQPPEVEETQVAEAEVTDAPPEETTAPTPDSLSQIPDQPTEKPQPKAAEIVAPNPSPDTPPETTTSDTVTEATTAEPAPEATPEPPTEEAAPKDTGEVLLTEDNKDKKPETAAPATSPRPQKKPEKKPEEPKPAPVETAEATPEAPADEPSVNADDAVAAALGEALSGEASEEPKPGTGAADQGPPLTSGEKDALIVAVKQCWNVGSLSTDALSTIVTVSVSMGQDGKPDSGSIRMIGVEGGTDASAQQAFEAGRRAIIRCAKNGYALPPEKYEQWKEIEITFDPNKMRLR